MTLYGWDASHWDWPRGPMDMKRAVAEGISFATHKLGDGSGYVDPRFREWWPKVHKVVPVVGAYWVLWPGVDPAGQADTFTKLLDLQAPGWRSVSFILQVDAERFTGMERPPSLTEVREFCRRLQEREPGKRPVVYAPRWLYQDTLAGLEWPLWASHYVVASGSPRELYPGDTAIQWQRYSGQDPMILQFTDRAIIAGQQPCCADAYRGTLDQLIREVSRMPMNIRTHPRGAAPDFALITKPSSMETASQAWMRDQLLLLEPGTQDGGGYAHKPGYHDTLAHNDQRSGVGNDYSNADPQDRRGPKDKTRARDWTFRGTATQIYTRMTVYGQRLDKSYRDLNDPRLNGWREALGQTDADKTSEGIDFRNRYYRTPDSTHEWHWHFSEDTEQVESFWNKWAILTVLAGWTTAEWRKSVEAYNGGQPPSNGGEDMSFETDQVPVKYPKQDPTNPTWTGPNALGNVRDLTHESLDRIKALQTQLTNMGNALTTAIQALAGQRDDLSVQELAAVLAPAVAQQVVATLPADRDDVTQEELEGAITTVLGRAVGPQQASS